MARCLLCEKEFVPNDDDEALYKYDYRYGVCPVCREDVEVGRKARKLKDHPKV